MVNTDAVEGDQVSNPETAYREFHASLRRYIARRLDDANDIDDVLQDVFLRVTRNRAALAAAKQPLAWLYSVARSAVIDHRRRSQKHATVVSDIVLEDIPDASADAPSDEFSDCLTPLVNNLPDTYRHAIRFVDIDGGRQTELAESLGVAFPTAKSRVQRARKQLKSSILECCRIERDALENVTSLSPGECAPDCC